MARTSQGWLGVGLIALAFFPTLRECAAKWLNDPQYSHGVLVPLFCLLLLHHYKDRIVANAKPWPVVGLAILSLTVAARMVAGAIYFIPLDGLALVVSLVGVVLIVGGWGWLRGMWPALVFSLFALPLPYGIERAMGAELQRLATAGSTFLLQVCGEPALAEGNTILIREIRLGVVEACSGLRMLTTFLAFSVAAIFLMQRSWMFKLAVLLSAAPIALLTNILRITGTGLAHVHLQEYPAKEKILDFIHDFNGWMMMPIGLLLLGGVVWVLKRLLIEERIASATAPKFVMN